MKEIRFPNEDRSSGNNLAEILNRYLGDYRKSYGLSLEQHKLVKALKECRTSRMGGHLNACGNCDYREISYNSCCNGNSGTIRTAIPEKFRTVIPEINRAAIPEFIRTLLG